MTRERNGSDGRKRRTTDPETSAQRDAVTMAGVDSLAGWTVAVTADRRADDQADMLRGARRHRR